MPSRSSSNALTFRRSAASLGPRRVAPEDLRGVLGGDDREGRARVCQKAVADPEGERSAAAALTRRDVEHGYVDAQHRLDEPRDLACDACVLRHL